MYALRRRFAPAAFSLLLLAAPGAAGAQAFACPDLATAVQAGTCPSEAQLKYGYTAYCSDNARMYDKSSADCADEKAYRRLKNVSLWESADGVFQGYLSCDLPAGVVKAARPVRVAVAKQGSITRLVCSYPRGISFAYRSRSACKVEGDGDCAANPARCAATCN